MTPTDPVPLHHVETPHPLLLQGTPSKLRTAIARTGYFQYQVAAAANINTYQLSRYCNRRARISAKHLQRLCVVLGVDPEDILEDPL